MLIGQIVFATAFTEHNHSILESQSRLNDGEVKLILTGSLSVRTFCRVYSVILTLTRHLFKLRNASRSRSLQQWHSHLIMFDGGCVNYAANCIDSKSSICDGLSMSASYVFVEMILCECIGSSKRDLL